MKNPSAFQLLVVTVLLVISLLNMYLGRNLFSLTLTKTHLISYIIMTMIFAFGMFSNFNNLPYGAQISRLCVFWFLIHIIIAPFWSVLFFSKFIIKTFTGLAIVSAFKWLAATILLLAFCISGYGSFYESLAVRPVRHDIKIKELDDKVAGLKIAQLTDLHLGIYFSLSDLRAVLEKTVAEKPDVLVITGDLIDDTMLIMPMVAILDEFYDKFPYGIYYCWGNHEYIRGYQVIANGLEKSKVQVLKNQNALLVDAQQPLYLIGLDYSFNRIGGASEEYDTMLRKATTGIAEPSTKVLLVHHSIVIDNAFSNKIDLTLTGHTHGTQVAVLGKPLFPWAFKYLRGMYRQENLYGYVSTGVSGWFPFRFGCPPEIAIFTLKKV